MQPISQRDRYLNYIASLQDVLCDSLQALEPKAKFKEDTWQRPLGGEGIARAIIEGTTFEKACVNTGIHFGEINEQQQKRLHTGPGWLFAASLQLAAHPRNPMVPAVYAHLRYVEIRDDERSTAIRDQWFSGGADLCPNYIIPEDAQHWHGLLAETCDAYDPRYYDEFKLHCDRVNSIAHRKETRGIGGVLLEELRAEHGQTLEDHYELLTSIGDILPEAYAPLVERNMDAPFQDQQRRWQQVRRGRLTEFSLMYDNNVAFQLLCDMRPDATLLVLPPTVRWAFDMKAPEPKTQEGILQRVLQNPVSWLERV